MGYSKLIYSMHLSSTCAKTAPVPGLVSSVIRILLQFFCFDQQVTTQRQFKQHHYCVFLNSIISETEFREGTSKTNSGTDFSHQHSFVHKTKAVLQIITEALWKQLLFIFLSYYCEFDTFTLDGS